MAHRCDSATGPQQRTDGRRRAEDTTPEAILNTDAHGGGGARPQGSAHTDAGVSDLGIDTVLTPPDLAGVNARIDGIRTLGGGDLNIQDDGLRGLGYGGRPYLGFTRKSLI